VHAVPAGSAFQLVARAGTTSVVPSFSVTRPSNIWSIGRGDSASAQRRPAKHLIDGAARLAVRDARPVENDRVGGRAEDELASATTAAAVGFAASSAARRRKHKCQRSEREDEPTPAQLHAAPS